MELNYFTAFAKKTLAAGSGGCVAHATAHLLHAGYARDPLPFLAALQPRIELLRAHHPEYVPTKVVARLHLRQAG